MNSLPMVYWILKLGAERTLTRELCSRQFCSPCPKEAVGLSTLCGLRGGLVKFQGFGLVSGVLFDMMAISTELLYTSVLLLVRAINACSLVVFYACFWYFIKILC